jgi:hypothetical protein
MNRITLPLRYGLASTILLAAFILATLPGCGGKKGPKSANLHGKVTYKGAPVTGGLVTLHPAAGGHPFPFGLDADGTYTTNGAPAGKMMVTVDTTSISQGGIPAGVRPPPGADPNAGRPPGVQLPTRVNLPPKFLTKETSGVTVEITGQDQTLDIALPD